MSGPPRELRQWPLAGDVDFGDVRPKEERHRPVEHDPKPAIPSRHLHQVVPSPEPAGGNPLSRGPHTWASAEPASAEPLEMTDGGHSSEAAAKHDDSRSLSHSSG